MSTEIGEETINTNENRRKILVLYHFPVYLKTISSENVLLKTLTGKGTTPNKKSLRVHTKKKHSGSSLLEPLRLT